MNFHKYIMTLILIGLHTELVCSGSIDGQEDEGENVNESSSTQPEDVKLDESVKEAIERSAMRALEQKFPQFFSTLTKTTSHDTNERALGNTVKLSSSTLRAIDGSVAFHLDKMLATLTLEKRTDEYLGSSSNATVIKSAPQITESSSSHPSKTVSSTAPPTPQTKLSLSEGSGGSVRPMSYAASLMKGKSIVRQNEPPAVSSRPVTIRNSSKSAEPEELERSLLIIPAILKDNSNALAELKKAGINLNEFGVQRTKSYVSGALRCMCYNKEYKKRLENAVRKLTSVSIKGKPITYSNLVRVQKIPLDVKEDEISECVQQQFSMRPEKISFIPYQDSRRDRVKAVAIHVDDALFQAMKEHAHLKVREREYDIDTKVHVTRCRKCGLLGHREVRCGNPARTLESISKSTKCIDCSSYNEQITRHFGKTDSRIRDDNHPTDDDRCPSKLHFMKPKRYNESGEE